MFFKKCLCIKYVCCKYSKEKQKMKQYQGCTRYSRGVKDFHAPHSHKNNDQTYKVYGINRY